MLQHKYYYNTFCSFGNLQLIDHRPRRRLSRKVKWWNTRMRASDVSSVELRRRVRNLSRSGMPSSSSPPSPPPPWSEIPLLRNVRSHVNPYSSNSSHRDINTYGEYVSIKQLLPTFIDFLKSALIQLRCIQCMTLDTPTFMDFFKSAMIYLRCIQCHTLHNASF